MKNHGDDIAVLYRSEEDSVWVAHSLRTDQVGVGNRIVDALADLIRAVDAVLAIAHADKTVAYLREAPADIQKLRDSAKCLPGEIYEVAHKMARGQWPDEIDPGFAVKDGNNQYVTEMKEPITA
jgi:hypothetical protein